MSNTLGVYNPIFYAQEALTLLEKSLGMAARVHRGFDEERKAFRQGEYVSIRKPSTLSAQNAPATAEDLATQTVQVQLAYWREVKFKLTDKELSFTGERIIEDHIRPAAYALADDIDQKLAALYVEVPWYYELASTAEVGDITGPRKVLFNNAVPLDPGRVHYMMDGTLEERMLKLSAFSNHQGSGDFGVNTQLRGYLGTRFGLECFSNQNVQTHVAGTCADSTGAIDFGSGTTAVYPKGATMIHIDGVTDGGDWHVGDTFVIAGNTQRYAVTSQVTFTGGEGDVYFTPPLVAAVDENAVVTGRVASKTENLAFHRNAFALVTAPLSEMGSQLGAKVATVQDPVTGLSLRSRLYYVGNSSEVHVAIDVLYGVKTLDPNLACRCNPA
jgi:hypothetical protein